MRQASTAQGSRAAQALQCCLHKAQLTTRPYNSTRAFLQVRSHTPNHQQCARLNHNVMCSTHTSVTQPTEAAMPAQLLFNPSPLLIAHVAHVRLRQLLARDNWARRHWLVLKQGSLVWHDWGTLATSLIDGHLGCCKAAHCCCDAWGVGDHCCCDACREGRGCVAAQRGCWSG